MSDMHSSAGFEAANELYERFCLRIKQDLTVHGKRFIKLAMSFLICLFYISDT